MSNETIHSRIEYVSALTNYWNVFVSDVRKIVNTLSQLGLASNIELRNSKVLQFFTLSKPDNNIAYYKFATVNSSQHLVPDHVLSVVITDEDKDRIESVRYLNKRPQVHITVYLSGGTYSLLRYLHRVDVPSRLQVLRVEFINRFFDVVTDSEFESLRLSNSNQNSPILQTEQLTVYSALHVADSSVVDYKSIVISSGAIFFERECGVFPEYKDIDYLISDSFEIVHPPTLSEPFSRELQLDFFPNSYKNGPLFFKETAEQNFGNTAYFVNNVHLPYLLEQVETLLPTRYGHADGVTFYGIAALQLNSWHPWYSDDLVGATPETSTQYAFHWSNYFDDGQSYNSVWYSSYNLPSIWTESVTTVKELMPNSIVSVLGIITTTDDGSDCTDTYVDSLTDCISHEPTLQNMINSFDCLLPTVQLRYNISQTSLNGNEIYSDFRINREPFFDLINQLSEQFDKPVYLALSVGLVTDSSDSSSVQECSVDTWSYWLSYAFEKCSQIQGLYLYLPFSVNSANIDAVNSSLRNLELVISGYQRSS